ncbi:MAG: hypothetical protein LBK02_07215 [Treponema sp.]|jgi:hypothetical protein|nr:hypothetical protein [Treponema sp.]
MGMSKNLFLVLSFLFTAPAFLSAQTAAKLDAVLETPAISCAQAAWFVLAALNTVPADSSVQDAGMETAFRQVMDNHWLPQKTSPGDPVTLKALSFLLMKAFDIKGGLMYAILPGPRYAFRTLVSRSLIRGAADPDMTVSGERFLHILGNVLSYAGAEL